MAGPGAPSVDEFAHYLKRGYSFLQGNNLVEAKENLEKSLEIKPGDSRALNLLAMVFFKLEQFSKAIKIFKQLIKINPSFPTLYMNLGLAYIKQGDHTSALPEVLRVLELDPNHPNVHNYLGLIYSKLGHYEEARAEFELANSPRMVEKMEEKLREASAAGVPPPEEYTGGEGGGGYAPPSDQGGAAPEMSFEQPPDAFSTFDTSVAEAPEAQAYGTAAPDQTQQEYAGQYAVPDQGQQEYPGQYTVPLAPPEGVVEEVQPPEEVSQTGGPAVQPAAIRSLKELSRALTISKENVPALHLRDESILQIVMKGGRVFARLAGMVASEGELTFDACFKRFKGKETKAVFGGDDDPIMKISGEGQILLSSRDHSLSLFNLEDEMIYLAESAVFAFQDGILWENGRIQTEGAEDLNLVQFKGRGTVSMTTKGSLVSIPLASRSSLTVDFHSLIGWFGKIVPQVKSVGGLPGGKGRKIVVELKGEGDVLIEETVKA